jgi:hypothetical protein
LESAANFDSESLEVDPKIHAIERTLDSYLYSFVDFDCSILPPSDDLSYKDYLKKIAVRLNENANDFIYNNEYEKGLENALEAWSIFERFRIPDCVEKADCAVTVAFGFGHKDHEKELQFLVRAHKTFAKLNSGDSFSFAECLKSLGGAYYWNFQFDKQLEYAAQALEMYTRLGMAQSEEAADCLRDIGIAHFETNDYRNELKYLREAARVYKSLERTSLNMADCLKRLAVSYLANSDYERYLAVALDALHEFEKLHDPNDLNMASALREVGNAYGWNENFPKQIEYLIRAADVYQKKSAAAHCEDIHGCLEEISNAYLFMDNMAMYWQFKKEADSMRVQIKQSNSNPNETM